MNAMTKAASIRPLTLPLPEVCTDDFAAGWALADGHIFNGDALQGVPPATWNEEKAVGYQHRLAAELQPTEALRGM
ncbi:hypothetical protein [Pseudomonas sp. GOM6]|uniref:hypothetical protein n=1 Tax=Pseudomonas sp. GOM6 TaxID=3036944 RepID=UPI00240A49C3|nr:hypothetical protein [Pseudomonas sp. GOM6]MDG1581043.1 hypothetical protein [Pseudomonas sp. GOM6]